MGWNAAEHNQVVKTLAVVCEVTGTDMSDPAKTLVVKHLAGYPAIIVLASLERCAVECKFKLTLADIVSRMSDGRPGAEEAWALMPKSEQDGAVVTDEMAAAWGATASLYEHGDPIAARMAFKETYERCVREARSSGTAVNWFISAGWNHESTESAAIDGVRRGLIPPEMAMHYLPPARQQEALRIAKHEAKALPEAANG